MSRLTKGYEKHNNEFISYVADISLYPEMMGYEQTQAEMDCINKLGTLEDLEAELGIDLITLFKALKNGVCIQEEGYFECPDIYFHSLEMEFVIGWANKENMGYELLKDYGKTWALDRNDLEEQDDE